MTVDGRAAICLTDSSWTDRFGRSSILLVTRRWLVPVTMLVALIGCAHSQQGDELEAANRVFARSIRWSDLKGWTQQVVPERRAEFLKLAGTDEDNLKVSDYELEDVQVSDDKAIVRSRVSWYRLPSITNRTEAMMVLWERKGGTWLITSIVGGPLPLPPPDAATAHKEPP